MADSLMGRRKKGMKPKKMMDAYGGADKTIDEMTEIAQSYRKPKPSISDTARSRYKKLLRNRIEDGLASLHEGEIYGPRKPRKRKEYQAEFRTTSPTRRSK